MHRSLLLLLVGAVLSLLGLLPRGASAAPPVAGLASLAAGDTPAAAAATPGPGPVAPGIPASSTKRWLVDPARSSFVLQVFKAGAAAALAHDHVVHATKYTARLSADPADPTTASIEVTVPTAALDIDDPAVRARFQLPANVSERDRNAVLEAMRGDEVLDVDRFPTIVFRSTAVKAAADGSLTLSGNLTLHGVTRPVAMPLSARVAGDAIDAQARFAFKTSDFGMPPYSAMFGAVRCKDEVVLNLHVVAVAR
jgi:polyisoprenoid-binding protein YceI